MERPQYNMRNPAVKRIVQEIKEVQADKSGDFMAEALEADIFEWHFMIRGPPDTEFEGGIYHGRILLPAEYPFKPPAFMMLTPNGRFETNVKICLSISTHHPEEWQPSWSIRTALTALVAFMPSPGAGALGALDYTKEERRKLAAKSITDIPRFGSADRQRIIDEMHARFLAAQPPARQADDAAQSAAGPQQQDQSAAGAAAAPPASAQHDAGEASGDAAADTEAAAGMTPPPSAAAVTADPQHSDSSSNTSVRKAADEAAVARPASPNAAAAGQGSTSSITTQPQQTNGSTVSTLQPPSPPPAAPARQQPTASHAAASIPSQAENYQAASSIISTGSTSKPAPQPAPAATAATQAAAPAPAAVRAAAAPAPDTWGLTVLAVTLGVLIVAILFRRALAAAGYEVPSLVSNSS